MGAIWTDMRNPYGREDTIDLTSPEGQNLLQGTDIKQNLLVRIFSKQQKMGYCGIQSAAMLMSAKAFGQKYPDPAKQLDCDVTDVPYVDYNMMTQTETTQIVTNQCALADGTTLAEVAKILRSYGVPAKTFYASAGGLDDFRAQAKDALSRADSSRGVMVNFDYNANRDDGTVERYGHHSLLGAYHEATDRFLLLDTWYNGKHSWYYAADLYKRMDTFDEFAGQRRGFLIAGISND